MKIRYLGKVYEGTTFINERTGRPLAQIWHNDRSINKYRGQAMVNYSEGKYKYANNFYQNNTSIEIIIDKNTVGGKLI